MSLIFQWAVIACSLAVASYFLISIVSWSWRNGISPMSTSGKAKHCLLELVPKELQGDIYELGSGWGTLAFPLARRYPQSKVVGFETSPVPFWFSKLRQMFSRTPNLDLHRQNFFQTSMKGSSLLICYLYPGAMRILKAKFAEELKQGTIVISNTFSIPGWKAEKIVEVGDIYNTKIYLYRIGKQ